MGIASIDFLKQEKILELLERANYDMVLLDEAHHCMDLGAIEEREDSQRRRLAEVLARRCDSLLLLTATPHDGNDRSFASLCELLDLSLVDGKGNLRGERYRNHVVRRLKSHIPDRFKTRIVEPKPVIANNKDHPDYMALQQGLLEFLAPELRKAFRKKRYSDVLAFLALLKRSVSTVEACKTTLTVVAERFQQLLTEGSETQESRRQRLKTLREYYRKLERFGTVSFEEEQEQFTLETEELAQKLAELQREVGSESRSAFGSSASLSLAKISSLVEALDHLIELADAAIEEIDHSLKGFQQTARTYPWLGDAGMNAENRLLTEADVAREKGTSTSGVDLFGFVRDAVLLDGGDFVSTQHPEIFTVHLPWSWSYGLDELPGYEIANSRSFAFGSVDVGSLTAQVKYKGNSGIEWDEHYTHTKARKIYPSQAGNR